MKKFFNSSFDLYFRDGTLDYWIFEQLNMMNEYKLDKFLKKNDIVLDIGAHAGYFSYLSLISGAKKAYLFEMHPENLEMCWLNMKQFKPDSYYISDKAVWRSDKEETVKRPINFPMWDTSYNTGGAGVVFGGDVEVETLSLDFIIGFVKEAYPFNKILMKIDVESSEWPILLTSKRLSEVDRIIGEYHEIGGLFDKHNPKVLDLGYNKYNIKLLQQYLNDNGFDKFHYNRYSGLNIGHFWAWKNDN